MANAIFGINCSQIKKRSIIKLLKGFLLKISTNYPKDFSKILKRVSFIKPVSKKNLKVGTLGSWSPHEGILSVSTDEKNLEKILFIMAHEFGHVCTTEKDLDRRASPFIEWAYEAAADWYLCKWGYRGLYKKYRKGCRIGHHGAISEDEVNFESLDKSYTFYLSKNFVYKYITSRPK